MTKAITPLSSGYLNYDSKHIVFAVYNVQLDRLDLRGGVLFNS